MSSYRQILYHTVIGTKDRKSSLPNNYDEELYRYIWGIVKKKNCMLYQINGSGDHIHLLTDLHPSVSLSDFIKDIKVASSKWMSKHDHFPLWKSWGEGYGTFTCCYNEKDTITHYIKNKKSITKKSLSWKNINDYW